MFQLEQLDPATYLSNTRKSSIILIVVFAASALALSSLLVLLVGTPGGNNFKLNLTGVLSGLGLTLLLVKSVFSKQPFMYEAVYSWRLKRSLMRITNKMHVVKQQALVQNPQALQLLNFYYRALEQMHRLEGNDAAILEIKVPLQETRAQLEELGLNPDNNRLEASWFEALE